MFSVTCNWFANYWRNRRFDEEQEQIQKKYDSVLPIEFVEEFELRFIQKRNSQTRQKLRKKSRAYTAWRAAQKMIVALGIEPSEWFYHTTDIYDYFYNKKYSLRYANSIRKFANLWGFYYCKKLGRPFLQIPIPKGYERQRLVDANYEKQAGVVRASKVLTPELLSEKKDGICEDFKDVDKATGNDDRRIGVTGLVTDNADEAV